MKIKITGAIIVFLLSFSFAINAEKATLPSKEYKEQMKESENAALTESKAIKASDPSDPGGGPGGSGEVGGGDVGGGEREPLPISDTLYPMLIGGLLYIGYTSRKKVITFLKKKN